MFVTKVVKANIIAFIKTKILRPVLSVTNPPFQKCQPLLHSALIKLKGWCSGNFQRQESLLQSEVSFCPIKMPYTIHHHFISYCSFNYGGIHQGHIFRSDITVVCKAMEFGLYPLDNHKCYLILTSCEYLSHVVHANLLREIPDICQVWYTM